MNSEEFILSLTNFCEDEESLQNLRLGVPLGKDASNALVFSQKQEKPFMFRHTCVTGVKKTAFIKRALFTLLCLYEKDEANVFIISPKTDYGELLRLNNASVTVPFIRTKADIDDCLACVKELISLREREKGCPRLILVLDGLEEIEGCNQNGDLEEYRAFFDVVARKKDVEIFSGAELMKSIFSGYPGAFVGVGNCLVTTIEEGKADVTYVGEDSSLSLPTPIFFPTSPSVTETIIWLNALSAEQKAIG
ncbi:MAG: hypothetical protein E7368_00710 [Clostridiales bacterium]|nr:hypothetical protein [Clostridiales bacterium]